MMAVMESAAFADSQPWVGGCPLSTDCLPLNYGTSCQSNFLAPPRAPAP